MALKNFAPTTIVRKFSIENINLANTCGRGSSVKTKTNGKSFVVAQPRCHVRPRQELERCATGSGGVVVHSRYILESVHPRFEGFEKKKTAA